MIVAVVIIIVTVIIVMIKIFIEVYEMTRENAVSVPQQL